jgi:hypothetical protein
MNREQIIKALGCISTKGDVRCARCDLRKYEGLACHRIGADNAISLIRELVEENESLKQAMEHEHASFMETFGEYGEKCERLTEENERIRASSVDYRNIPYFVADAKADTVRKMQKMIEDRCIKGGIYPAFVARVIEQVAEEILAKENDSQSVSQSTDTCVSCGNIIPEGRQVCHCCEVSDNEL